MTKQMNKTQKWETGTIFLWPFLQVLKTFDNSLSHYTKLTHNFIQFRSKCNSLSDLHDININYKIYNINDTVICNDVR